MGEKEAIKKLGKMFRGMQVDVADDSSPIVYVKVVFLRIGLLERKLSRNLVYNMHQAMGSCISIATSKPVAKPFLMQYFTTLNRIRRHKRNPYCLMRR